MIKNLSAHHRGYSNMEMADMYFDEERPFLSNGLAQVLEKVVRTMSQQQEERITIEAHCDERGTGSYNLVLGEQRGRAIAQYLALRGVNPKHINAISYGEEAPLCLDTGRICREANLRIQKSFQFLSFNHSRNGCITRILLKQTIPLKGQWVKGHHNPFNQQIHVASPKTSAWSLSH